MTWDVEIWHDTTMWNEGFGNAREPYVVVRVTDEQAAKVVETSINLYDKALEDQGRKGGDPGWDRRFEARIGPSNPNRQTGTSFLGLVGPLPTMQAVGFVQGAISKWGGI